MPGRVLLDTHVVVEAATKGGWEAMPARVRGILEDLDVELLLSVASEFEIAIKSRIGKLALSRREVSAICDSASIASYPLLRRHAERLFELPLQHHDPFDRMIIATALSDNLPLISCDKHFRKYKGLQVIW